MSLHHRFESRRQEQRLQERRRERSTETKQAERMSAILAKKVGPAAIKPEALPDRVAS
jgi:hypothetical protein